MVTIIHTKFYTHCCHIQLSHYCGHYITCKANTTRQVPNGFLMEKVVGRAYDLGVEVGKLTSVIIHTDE
jgi:hypothetical protein